MSLFRLEEKRKKYEISAKNRTKVAVHRPVYELIRYYAIKKNKTVTQATYEIIREGFRTTGWFNGITIHAVADHLEKVSLTVQ